MNIIKNIVILMLMLSILNCNIINYKEIILGKELSTGLSNLLADFDGKNNIGYILFDPKTKEVLLSHNRNKGFIPASTTKIITAAAALDFLGEDYRFETGLSYTGNISDGILNGDLFLKGGGDPYLKISDLMLIVDGLFEKDVKKINGKFYFDDNDLINIKKIDDDMEDFGAYNPGVSSLSLEFNRLHVEWEYKDKKKWRTLVRNRKKIIEKEIKWGENRSELKKWKIYFVPEVLNNKKGIYMTSKKEYPLFTYKEKLDKEQWLMSSFVKKRKGREKLPVKNSALYTAQVFQKLCKIRGIKISNPERGKTKLFAKELYLHKSKPLLKNISTLLAYSNNLMAELIMLWAVKEKTGKKLNLKDSSTFLEKYFADLLNNINWESFRLINGSGLTVKNRISPEQLLAVLIHLDRKKYDDKSFMNLLPYTGGRGTLLRRMKEPDTQYRVWAKTGGLFYSSALTGFLFTKSGKKLMFSILASDEDTRKKFDALYSLKSRKKYKRIKNAERKGWAWNKKYMNLTDSLLKEWIKKY